MNITINIDLWILIIKFEILTNVYCVSQSSLNLTPFKFFVHKTVYYSSIKFDILCIQSHYICT